MCTMMIIANGIIALLIFLKHSSTLMSFLIICAMNASEILVNRFFLNIRKRLLEPPGVACRAVA